MLVEVNKLCVSFVDAFTALVTELVVFCATLQPVFRAAAQWTEDGLATALALGLVAAGLTSEHAAPLRLRMAAKIVLAMQSAHAIRKPVQVRMLAQMSYDVCFLVQSI